jgi:hypothetical protein
MRLKKKSNSPGRWQCKSSIKLWSSLRKVTFEITLGVWPNNMSGKAYFLFSQ